MSHLDAHYFEFTSSGVWDFKWDALGSAPSSFDSSLNYFKMSISLLAFLTYPGQYSNGTAP